MILLDANLIILSTLDSHVLCYDDAGQRQFKLSLPSPILQLRKFNHKIVNGFIVSLDNGQIRLYQNQNCLSILDGTEPSADLTFGAFKGEEGALFSLSRSSKKLKLHILKRNAFLNYFNLESQIKEFGMKKTKAFVDCVKRERQFSNGKRSSILTFIRSNKIRILYKL